MSAEPFSLSTASETLLGLPVADALTGSKESKASHYGQVFFNKAKQAEASGDARIATAWRLLGQLAMVGLQESDVGEPFRPMWSGPDGRSLLPSDLDDVTARAVQQMAQATADPELRARLSDITWVRLRDPNAARQAVQSYVESANRLFDPGNWLGYAARIERAVRLARQLKDAQLAASVLAEIELRVLELNGSDPLYLSARLMELLHEFRHGDSSVMTQIAQKAAQVAEAAKNFERARSHHENVARWRRLAKDDEGERNAKIAIAESYVGEAGLNCSPGAELAAAHFLEQAHEAYRNIPGTRERTEEIYGLLREAQLRARRAFGQVRSEGTDIAPLIKAARDQVSGKTFKQALLALATVTQPTNFETETKTAREIMEKYPLQSILGGVKVDDDGRIVAQRTSALTSNEEQAKQVLWERVVEQVTMGYQLDAQAAIVPAINQVMFEHSPSLRDMRDLVINNPIVPPGHEELFARGFLEGLRWNFAEALSILVPQVENSLRHLLARTGAEITTRDKHGLQTVISMGTILSDREAQLAPIIGPDNIKELKILFTDQHGLDLRNRIAHGLMSHGEFFGAGAIYAWWFILFLCINPVYRRFQKDAGAMNNENDGEEPTSTDGQGD